MTIKRDNNDLSKNTKKIDGHRAKHKAFSLKWDGKPPIKKNDGDNNKENKNGEKTK